MKQQSRPRSRGSDSPPGTRPRSNRGYFCVRPTIWSRATLPAQVPVTPALFAKPLAVPGAGLNQLPIFHPFPLICAFICVHTGRLKTIIHHHILAIALAQTGHLRCIWTLDGVENRAASFWIPRRALDRKKGDVERMCRSRLHRTLRAPCWTGTSRPPGYRAVQLRAKFPSLGYLVKLCRNFGYTWAAAGAALPRAHAPWMHPHSDKHRNVCTSLSDIEGNDATGRDYHYPHYFRQSSNRIRKIQSLLDTGLLRIRYAPFVSILFEQAERFLFTTENCAHEDGVLDVLSFLCGFSQPHPGLNPGGPVPPKSSFVV